MIDAKTHLRANIAFNFAIREIEELAGTVRTGRWAGISQTGDAYVAFQEEDANPFVCIDAWALQLRNHVLQLGAGKGTLYIRTPPEIRVTREGCGIYARVVYTDRPVDPALDATDRGLGT